MEQGLVASNASNFTSACSLSDLSIHYLSFSTIKDVSQEQLFLIRTLAMTELAYRSLSSQVSDEERDIRVEDYLDDKLQNSTDLANIDALLEDVKAQQVLLQKQVRFSSP